MEGSAPGPKYLHFARRRGISTAPTIRLEPQNAKPCTAFRICAQLVVARNPRAWSGQVGEEWSRFRERFAAFRKLFASANDNQEIIRHMQEAQSMESR